MGEEQLGIRYLQTIRGIRKRFVPEAFSHEVIQSGTHGDLLDNALELRVLALPQHCPTYEYLSFLFSETSLVTGLPKCSIALSAYFHIPSLAYHLQECGEDS